MSRFEPAFLQIKDSINYTYHDGCIDGRIHRAEKPDLHIWKVLDKTIALHPGHYNNVLCQLPEFRMMVKTHYRIALWNRLKGDQLHNWRIANLVFKMAYRMNDINRLWGVWSESLGTIIYAGKAANLIDMSKFKEVEGDIIATTNLMEEARLADALYLQMKFDLLTEFNKGFGPYDPKYIDVIRDIYCR
jgi:hypothetical protein